ncbi:MAG: hypothetical protein JST70_01820 [Bacteroidetes bacterium]|nr:hypothetical protein [Bacteroidota bacterium]
MDIVQAKAIPLCRIFEVLGSRPAPTLNGLQLYKSPFNPEQKTMLVVNPETNTWSDPVTNENGDTVQLIVRYLESQQLQHSIMDALRWMRNMIGNTHQQIKLPAEIPDHTKADSIFRVKDQTYLSDNLLMQYVEEERGIPFHIAREYFKQLTILNTTNGKSFVALGFENEDGGFAIRNPLHKAHIGKRAITFIRGRKAKPSNIHVFKDIFDYLSIVLLRNGKCFDGDSIILNSSDCLQDMTAYIRNYGYCHLHSWFANDEAGATLTNIIRDFCEAEQLQHHDRRQYNKKYYDLNARLVAEVCSGNTSYRS